MLAVKLALDRVPHYQAEIKDWVHRQTGYTSRFARVAPTLRWYGPELYFERLELRSKDDQRVLARAAGGRIGIDIWQLMRSGKLFARPHRARRRRTSSSTRLGPAEFALASEIVLGGEGSPASTLTLNDLPAGTLVIRQGVVTSEHWNAELPQARAARGRSGSFPRVRFLSTHLVGASAAVLGGQSELHGHRERSRRAGLRPVERAGACRRRLLSRLAAPAAGYLERLDEGTGSFQTAARGRGATLERMDLDFGAQGVVTRLSDGANTRMDEVSARVVPHSCGRSLDAARQTGARAARRPARSELRVRRELAG